MTMTCEGRPPASWRFARPADFRDLNRQEFALVFKLERVVGRRAYYREVASC